MRTTYKIIEKVHLRLEFKDKPSFEQADLFHAAVRLCCRAYPIDPMRRPDEQVKICETCKGFEWVHPQGYMTPKVLKTLAKQLSIRIKIRAFIEHCPGHCKLQVPLFQ